MTPRRDDPSAPRADDGLFGPRSTTWDLSADPLVGVAGLRALLLQALHPIAMRAVADNSGFRSDPWARLSNTADYVATTTFGTTAEAERMGALVRGVHSRISALDPDSGRTYRADDEDLLLWVHCALVDSILDVVDRGRGGLADGEGDRFVAEQVRSARLVGLPEDVVPASVAELEEYLAWVRPQLGVTPAAREAAQFITAPPMPPLVRLATPARPAWAGVAGLAFATLPAWARRMYALPELPGAAGLTDTAATGALRGLRRVLQGVQTAVPAFGGPRARDAREQMQEIAVIDLVAAETAASAAAAAALQDR